MLKKYIHKLLFFGIIFTLFLQGPAQAQNLRDSLADAKSDIVVKVITRNSMIIELISRSHLLHNGILIIFADWTEKRIKVL